MMFLLVMVSVFVLSACDPDVYIQPDVIGLIYEDPYYEDGSFYLTVYLTNGTDEEVDIFKIAVEVLTDDENVYIAGMVFEVDTTVKPDEYKEFELEFFGPDGLFQSESDLEALGYEIDDYNDISVNFEVMD